MSGKSYPDPQPPYGTSYLVWTTDADRNRQLGTLQPTWHWAVSGPRGFRSGCEVSAQDATDRAYFAYGLMQGNHERGRDTE